MRNNFFFKLYFKNVLLGLKNKTIYISGIISNLLILAFFIPMLFLTKGSEEVSQNLMLLKPISYIFISLAQGIFVALIIFYYYGKHKENGLIKNEQRSGIKYWFSYMIRILSILTILLTYITILIIISAIIHLLSKQEIFILNYYMWKPIGFLILFSIIWTGMIIFVCSFFSTSIGLLVSTILTILFSIYPVISGGIKINSKIRYYQYNISHLKISAGNYFYNSLKDDEIVNEIFADQQFIDIFRDNYKLLQLQQGNVPSDDEMVIRSLYLGQIYNSETNPINNTKIGQIAKDYYDATQEFTFSDTNFINDWLFSSSNANNISDGNIKKYIEYLNTHNSTAKYKNLTNTVWSYYKSMKFSIYNNDYYKTNNLFNLLNRFFPIILGDNNKIFENTNEILNRYREKAESMIFNYVLINLYVNSVYFDVTPFKTSTFDDETNEFQNILAVDEYANVFKTNNSIANFNFLDNLSYVFYGIDKTYKAETIYAQNNSMLLLTTVRPVMYYSGDSILSMISSNYKNYEKDKWCQNTQLPEIQRDDLSVFSHINKKGGINFTLLTISWLVFSILLNYINCIIFKIKIKD